MEINKHCVKSFRNKTITIVRAQLLDCVLDVQEASYPFSISAVSDILVLIENVRCFSSFKSERSPVIGVCRPLFII